MLGSTTQLRVYLLKRLRVPSLHLSHSSMQVVSQRRPHTKSRYGCLQCKKKRTKCDEKKPSCGRCSRTGVKCSFITQTCSLVVITAPHLQFAQTRNTVDATATSRIAIEAKIHKKKGFDHEASISSNNVPVEVNFTAAERHCFRLMNHYVHFTYPSLIELTHKSEDMALIWRTVVPHLAVEHDFLLQGLLGLSSLHLVLSQPYRRRENIANSVQHYGNAIALARPHLSNVTEYEINGIFVFSYIIALYSFGIHRIFPSQLSPLAKLIEVMSLIRGIYSIAELGSDWLDQTPLVSLKRYELINYLQNLSPELEDSLAQLRQRTYTTIGTTAHTSAYRSAISLVRESFLVVLSGHSAQKAMALFPILVESKLMIMVRLGEPLALAILAHYAVILHWLRGHIWLEGWGEEIVHAISQVLPSDWHVCIAWALQEVASSHPER
ncbi:hypothetical protein V1509DRAFT_640144 [Lipomyces kononenkoae]